MVRLGDQLIWQVSLLESSSAQATARAEVSADTLAGLRAKAPLLARALAPAPFPTTTQTTLLGLGGGTFIVGATGALLFGVRTAQIAETLDSPTAALSDKQRAFDDAASVPWLFVGSAGAAVVGVALAASVLVFE